MTKTFCVWVIVYYLGGTRQTRTTISHMIHTTLPHARDPLSSLSRSLSRSRKKSHAKPRQRVTVSVTVRVKFTPLRDGLYVFKLSIRHRHIYRDHRVHVLQCHLRERFLHSFLILYLLFGGTMAQSYLYTPPALLPDEGNQSGLATCHCCCTASSVARRSTGVEGLLEGGVEGLLESGLRGR